MVFIIRFEGFFIVLSLLLLSFGLQNLSIQAFAYHHQERRLMGVNSVKETQEIDDAYLDEKKLVYGVGSSKQVMRMGSSGRKMGMMLKKKDEEMSCSRSSSSGDDAKKLNVEAGFVAFTADYHGQENTLERMAINPSQNSRKQGFSRSVPSSTSFNTNKIFSEEDTSDEWRKLLEDADKKVMQMMRRDYSGMRRPRRKPPINNHEPRN
ncbi:hypothetical protein L6452_41421 [Arctium lappa]|uniref:Uncharacterized protein n=1 Tax=Arctium lappa TaxID=4217 RepID=A0ACB8XNB6_ARCLA|nr:hypothetical protein L6452_41421 [Arctium lappa]